MSTLKKIVAIVGDFYHDAELAKQSLLEALDPLTQSKKVELKFALVTHLSEELKRNPDVFVLFAEDRMEPETDPQLKWMTHDISDQIVDYVNNGGAWFGWHSGLASYDPTYSFVEMQRGYFLSHPDQHKPVKYVASEDTVFDQQIEPFEFMDEHYFVHCDEAKTNVFLRSSSEDGESIAGWHHVFGQGRICCLAPAHRREGLMDPTFIRILRHSLSWTASL